MAFWQEEFAFFFFPPSRESFVQLLNRSVKVTVWRVFGCLNVKLTRVRCGFWELWNDLQLLLVLLCLSFGRQAQLGAQGCFDSQNHSLLMS